MYFAVKVQIRVLPVGIWVAGMRFSGFASWDLVNWDANLGLASWDLLSWDASAMLDLEL